VTRFPTKVLGEQLNNDGTLSLLVDVRGLTCDDDDIRRAAVEPSLDIQRLAINRGPDGKLLSVDYVLRSGSGVSQKSETTSIGEPITLIFEE
jgi:hypothetical protein